MKTIAQSWILLALAGGAGCGVAPQQAPLPGQTPEAVAAATVPGAPSAPKADEYPVPPPPFSEGIYPCSFCHDMLDPNPTPRVLNNHDAEQPLRHGPGRWCYDCHNPKPMDVLRLANGTTIPFSESYRLCGQCHGDKYRDWKVGVHGKRTGSWNGKKEYRLCVNCHNPHAPHFKPLRPLPPPVRPAEIHE